MQISNTATTNNKNRKRVVFGDCGHVEASEIHSLSESQKASLWYTREDMDRFQSETRTLLRHRERFDATKDSWRGLESGLNKKLYQARKQSIRSILQLHKDNKKNGLADPSTGMASLAMQVNRDAVNRAILLAARDMRDARSIQHRDAIFNNSNNKDQGCFSKHATCTGPSQKRKPAVARTA